ncbi:hypothetical protein [Larkinella arboricola]
MLHLFWTLLNIGLIIFFLVICFRATKLIREKMGLFAAVVFVVGLFSGSSTRKESKPTRTIGLAPKINIRPDSHRIRYSAIDKNWVNRLELTVETGIDSTSGKTVALSATPHLMGSITGYGWEPHLVSVEATKDRKITYGVSGTMHWKLLGVTVYDEVKHLTGTLEANPL